MALKGSPAVTEPVGRDQGRQQADQQSSPVEDKLNKLVEGTPAGETDPEIPHGTTGARAAAVQALYESDASGHPARRALERLALYDALGKSDAKLADRLVSYVEAHRLELDRKIGEFAVGHPVDSIANVDRNVLRVALAEMELRPETPRRVIVNEAVEVAALFGGDLSPKFVNGVLGALLR